jgi:hypothetical protein
LLPLHLLLFSNIKYPALALKRPKGSNQTPSKHPVATEFSLSIEILPYFVPGSASSVLKRERERNQALGSQVKSPESSACLTFVSL